MSISRDQDLKLKFGNLFLSSVLSIVPTLMTLGLLAVHGSIICRTLDNRLQLDNDIEIKQICDESNLEIAQSYFVWILLIIMLPTWRWFYLWHYRRTARK